MADTKFKSNSAKFSKEDDSIEQPEFKEVVIALNRVARVVKGGRRFRFQALVAVGDGASRVGIGVSKGGDVQAAVVKATAVAKKNLITVPLYAQTIPHDVEGKVGGSRIMLKPASPGTGIIAGGTVRSILNLTSIHNILSKSLGSSNKINTAYATISALKALVPKTSWMKDHRVESLKLSLSSSSNKQESVKKVDATTKVTTKTKVSGAKPKSDETPPNDSKKSVSKSSVSKSKKPTVKKSAIASSKKVVAKKAVTKKSTAKKEGDK
jgi:small subunit ribosomal protein S5